MGRKKPDRDQTVGRKLGKLKDLMGSYKKILDDSQWMNNVKIFDDKTIRRYVNEGVPLSKVAAIEHYIQSKCDENGNFSKFIEDTPEDEKIKGAPEKFDHLELPGNPDAVSALNHFVHEWFEMETPYHSIEKQFHSLNVDLFQTKPFQDQNDPHLHSFMMACSLHYGRNWGYWVRRNKENDIALKLLLHFLNTKIYFRLRLRGIYALQVFSPENVMNYMPKTVDSELKRAIVDFSLKGNGLEYILAQKAFNPDKVNKVLIEIREYWGEKIPGLGLFGMEDSG